MKDRRGTRDPASIGLATVRSLVTRLGITRPDVVVRVVGANGKGSTAACLAAACARAGCPSIAFLSPWVHGAHEQAWIGGQPVSPARWQQASSRTAAIAAELSASVFEAALATALCLGEEAGARVAILEAGFGGPGDAVALWMDDLRIFCSLEVEHAWLLGSTLAEVAASELSDLSQGTPVVFGPGPGSEIIARAVERRGGRPHQVPKVRPPVPGRLEWPAENRARAQRSWSVLRELSVVLGEWVPGDCPPLPGRCELRDGRWLDAAHTPQAARALRRCFAGPVRWLLVILQDKDLVGILEELLRDGDDLFALRSPHPRARPAQQLVDAAVGIARVRVRVVDHWSEVGIDPSGAPVVVTGSFVAVSSLPAASSLPAGPSGLPQP